MYILYESRKWYLYFRSIYIANLLYVMTTNEIKAMNMRMIKIGNLVRVRGRKSDGEKI